MKVGSVYSGMMKARANGLPCALAIGGLDPGGGAGLAADLRAFSMAGAFGCAAAAVLTVQSTSGLRSARAVSAREMIAQANEVTLHQDVRALKSGALGSVANVRALATWAKRHAELPLVIDTVMLPTRGRSRLLAASALHDVKSSLIPRAWLVTANAPEAEALTQARVTTVREARVAAIAIRGMGARAVLVKGGHLGGPHAIDVLAIDDDVVELRGPRISLAPVHGGGCMLASLIAGRLAVSGERTSAGMIAAVRWAKKVHHRLLVNARDVGGELRVLMP